MEDAKTCRIFVNSIEEEDGTSDCSAQSSEDSPESDAVTEEMTAPDARDNRKNVADPSFFFSSIQWPQIFSFLICTAIYGGVATTGYLMFGERTLSQITLNLPKEYSASKVAMWATVINPFTKYAVLLNPLVRSFEELLAPVGTRNEFFYSILVRMGLVFSTVCVALLVPFFGQVMALIGSFLGMLVTVIFPPLCFLKLASWKKVTTTEAVLSIFIIGLGIVAAAFGTYSSVSRIMHSY